MHEALRQQNATAACLSLSLTPKSVGVGCFRTPEKWNICAALTHFILARINNNHSFACSRPRRRSTGIANVAGGSRDAQGQGTHSKGKRVALLAILSTAIELCSRLLTQVLHSKFSNIFDQSAQLFTKAFRTLDTTALIDA